MNRSEHYAYRVRWSAEDEAYVGTVAEFPPLSWVAPVSTDAFTGIRELAADTVDDMLASDEQPPAPIAERDYSGKFQVRVPPELHRQLAIEAAEQNVSLNRLATLRLALCAGPTHFSSQG
ncbi:type II toxin-antitoxin system HicB family antitoxin [Nocardiopsis nanhaiensis]